MQPLLSLAKRKYEKNYVEKKKTDSGFVRIYDEKHVKQRWAKKEKKLKALEKSIEKLRKKYHQDLKSDDARTRAIAAIVGLMDNTAMRIGNPDSVDEFDTFGATTLQRRHVNNGGGKLRFRFVGKANVKQDHVLHDAAVAKEIRALLKGKGPKGLVFEYEDGKNISGKVANRYLAQFNISAKDLRGFAANHRMKQQLKKTKNWDKALEEVARDVGHEPRTLENQYLAPSLVKQYKPGKEDKPKKKSSLVPLFKIAADPRQMLEAAVDRILGKTMSTFVSQMRNKSGPSAAPFASPGFGNSSSQFGPTITPSGFDPESFKSFIANKESGGSYNPPTAHLPSGEQTSAAGKYQFVWSLWGPKIRDFAQNPSLTREQFIQSPHLQEEWMNHYIENFAAPAADRLAREFPNVGLDGGPPLTRTQLMGLYHFIGEKSLRDALQSGKLTNPYYSSSAIKGYIGYGGNQS